MNLAPEITAEPLAARWLMTENFRDERWRERWWVEASDARVHSTADGLQIDNEAAGDEPRDGVTVWLREALPRDVVVQIKARTLRLVERNACNLNLLLHAMEPDGSPLRPGRSGDYAELHRIPNYIVTFTGGDKPGWSRVRRDPGFNLVSEADIRTEPGLCYLLEYRIAAGRIEVWVNGRAVHSWLDDDPLPGGRMGLRTWRSHVVYEEVKVGVPVVG